MRWFIALWGSGGEEAQQRLWRAVSFEEAVAQHNTWAALTWVRIGFDAPVYRLYPLEPDGTYWDGSRFAQVKYPPQALVEQAMAYLAKSSSGP